MHPQGDQGRPDAQEPADAAPSAPAAPRPPWRLFILIGAALAVALLATVVITYLAGGFTDEGRYRAEPPACATIAPSLHLLGVAYTTQQTDSNSCNLVLPRDHPAYIPAPKITISYGVFTASAGDAPDAASQELRRIGVAGYPPLPGVGDEAYIWDGGVVMRVSNLVVAIVVYPLETSTEDQVRAFAADLANRLGDT